MMRPPAATPDAPTPPRTLTVIVACRDEALHVEAAIELVLAAPLPAGVELLQVVAVDDGSRDGTGALVRAFAEQDPRLECVRLDPPRGRGAALRAGIARARGEIVVAIDADLEHDPREIAKLVAPIVRGDADVVLGSRWMGGSERRANALVLVLVERALSLAASVAAGVALGDATSGFFAARGDLLRSVPIRSHGYASAVELAIKLAKRGSRICEVDVTYRGRTVAEGRKRRAVDAVWALAAVVRYWLIDDLYDARYGESILRSLSQAHRFNRWLADLVLPHVGASVLEIGAGLGNLTQRLSPRCARYLATDIDPVYLAYLRQRYAGARRVGVRHLDLADPTGFAELAGTFDTVVATNVVEHVADDARALSNLYAALAPGGCACVIVPNGPWLYGSLDLVLEHARRYTKGELARKLALAGFVDVRIRSFNRVTVPAWWINGRLLRRTRFGRFQLKIFDSTVWLWRLIDGLFPWPGLSLVAIARRPERGLAIGAPDGEPGAVAAGVRES